jgi:HPr kinase/phosphorylase
VIAEIPTGLIHATAVAVHGSGLLITGPSGSGKSGLALQLIALGADLICDDQVLLKQDSRDITLHPAPNLSGKIEARHFGILTCPTVSQAPLALVLSLADAPEQRLPQPRKIPVGTRKIDFISGKNVPNLASAVLLYLR